VKRLSVGAKIRKKKKDPSSCVRSGDRRRKEEGLERAGGRTGEPKKIRFVITILEGAAKKIRGSDSVYLDGSERR